LNPPVTTPAEASAVPVPKRRNWKRLLGITAAIAALLALGLDVRIGSGFVAPVQRPVPLPTDIKYSLEAVSFPSASGAVIKGWLVPAKNSKAVIILMHGVGANRRQMLARADFLYNAGYSVLLFDFQAHGESLGKHITFGYLESRDATAAVAFARQRFPGEKIATIGFSMGGAAELLAQPPLVVDAMVVESCYPTIEQAIEDRMIVRFGKLGRLVPPLLTWQMEPRLGISVDDLRPIQQVPKLTVPKFFMAGEADPNTTLPESQALFAAAAEPKQLWIVPGARHEDLHHFAPQPYEKQVLAFLAKNLN